MVIMLGVKYTTIMCYNNRDNRGFRTTTRILIKGSHRLEKHLNLEGFLEKSLKNKSALKSTGKSPKCLEKLLNSTIFL